MCRTVTSSKEWNHYSTLIFFCKADPVEKISSDFYMKTWLNVQFKSVFVIKTTKNWLILYQFLCESFNLLKWTIQFIRG